MPEHTFLAPQTLSLLNLAQQVDDLFLLYKRNVTNVMEMTEDRGVDVDTSVNQLTQLLSNSIQSYVRVKKIYERSDILTSGVNVPYHHPEEDPSYVYVDSSVNVDQTNHVSISTFIGYVDKTSLILKDNMNKMIELEQSLLYY